MDDFDYKRAYDHVANILVNGGPVKPAPLPPLVMVLAFTGGEVFATALPVPPLMLGGAKGRAMLNGTLNELLDTIEKDGDRDCCVVIVAEAITVTTKLESGDPLPLPTAHLKEHPDAQPAIVVRVFRPEGERLGLLPLGPDRTLTYQDMVVPQSMGAPAGATRH